MEFHWNFFLNEREKKVHFGHEFPNSFINDHWKTGVNFLFLSQLNKKHRATSGKGQKHNLKDSKEQPFLESKEQGIANSICVMSLWSNPPSRVTISHLTSLKYQLLSNLFLKPLIYCQIYSPGKIPEHWENDNWDDVDCAGEGRTCSTWLRWQWWW